MITTKQFADKFNIPHRSVLNAANKAKLHYDESHFVKTVYISKKNTEFFCYNMSDEGAYFTMMFLTSKKLNNAKREYLRDMAAMSRTNDGDNELSKIYDKFFPSENS